VPEELHSIKLLLKIIFLYRLKPDRTIKTAHMDYPTINNIRNNGIRPVKKRGQNFLIDKNIAEKAVSHAHILPDDIVLEIGPGPGSLTYFLTQTNARIFSFEIDNNLFNLLNNSLSNEPNAQIINKDILEIDFNDYADENANTVLIGSIPYSITTPILLKFLENSSIFKRAVFIIQKEVAERLCAEPGSKDYGIFSIYCSTYLKSSIVQIIPSHCFFPKPKIDSATIELVPIKDKNWNSDNEKLFRKIVRASFSNRRKTLSNSLKKFLHDKSIDQNLFSTRSKESGIDLSRRAETLSVDEFYKLTEITRDMFNK
jgi:16S rRNA (adenine1518-N6/adenine1519-N6)-dimethyltransferase